MTEFMLVLMIYSNQIGGGFQVAPMGEYATKTECETYAAQVKKDFSEPSRTLRASCLPKSALQQGQAPVVKK